jgi:probable addiction module antidote protein
MPKRTTSHEPGLYKGRQDPAYAMQYLRAALRKDDTGADAVFFLSLRDFARAHHMTYIAQSTGIKRENLYKMLSRRGSRAINSLRVACGAVGLRLPAEGRGTKNGRAVAALLKNLQP